MVIAGAIWTKHRLVGRIWSEEAACRAPGVDPEVFFSDGDAGSALAQVAAAKRICAGCAVQALCLASALRRGEPEGIWGGSTPRERRSLRARLRRSAGSGTGSIA